VNREPPRASSPSDQEPSEAEGPRRAPVNRQPPPASRFHKVV